MHIGQFSVLKGHSLLKATPKDHYNTLTEYASVVARPYKVKKRRREERSISHKCFFLSKRIPTPLFSVACVLSEQLLSGFFLPPRQNEEEVEEEKCEVTAQLRTYVSPLLDLI